MFHNCREITGKEIFFYALNTSNFYEFQLFLGQSLSVNELVRISIFYKILRLYFPEFNVLKEYRIILLNYNETFHLYIIILIVSYY